MTTTSGAPGARIWIEAARPRTLPAAVAPVLVGTAAAEAAPRDLDPVRFVLALLVALALQVAVNFANDYFDGVKGVDTEARTGPRRVVAAGLVCPGAMKRAIAATIAVAGVAGLALAALAGWELLLVGVAAVLATLGYSGGAKPYASAGLGEVFVFVFFGVVATVGSQYVQDGHIGAVAVVASLAMGCLATALLVVNNLRDIPSDTEVGKRTLAVRLGETRTRWLYVALVLGAFAVLVALVLMTGEGLLLLPALTLVLAWRGVTLVRHAPLGPRLIAALEHTARTQLVFALLLTGALLLTHGPA
jgi:1,4-dihydroxy-2-naphthoate polyprenyltransferase